MEAADGKLRDTDALDTKGILQLIQNVHSSNTEDFKAWLSSVNSNTIDEYKATRNSAIIMYTTKDCKTNIRVEVDCTENTVWLSQAQMAELFQSTIPNVNIHIANVFNEGELEEDSTVKDYLTVQNEGGREVQRSIKLYNLDVIISVGYRIKSLRGTQFRIWATKVLHEYIKKGFALNDELLKEAGGGNYYKELLARIRDIRSSEKVLYRQVLDLFATSMDYDGKSETARLFFKQVQNKLHFASHGHTAAEIIAERASADAPFMGLTVFKGDIPEKSEVKIAKNYLTENELATLNHIVSAFFELATVNALKKIPMYMKDWLIRLDRMIAYNDYPPLNDAGKVSHLEAETIAIKEYEKYKEKNFEELSVIEKEYIVAIKDLQKKIDEIK
jgi:hypothetical protein